MLWRSLKDVAAGCYLDIGAQDPDRDSVSKAFYEAGWRGVHVEANVQYVRRLRERRPDERVVHALVGDGDKSAVFYEIPETGLSTGVESIAQHHREAGYQIDTVVVPCITLAEILTSLADETIHWMKIDVEGMEADVLRSWGDCPVRPWVLSIEATYPNSQTRVDHEWLDLVVGRGYAEVYFDGLSRYFLHETQIHRAEAFASPPNVFDGFAITEEHFSAGLINRHANERAHGLEVTLAEREQYWAEEASRAAEQLDAKSRALELASGRLTDANTEIVHQRTSLLAELKQERERIEVLAAEAAANAIRAGEAIAAAARERAFCDGLAAAHAEQREVLSREHAARIEALDDHLASVRHHLAETQKRLELAIGQHAADMEAARAVQAAELEAANRRHADDLAAVRQAHAAELETASWQLAALHNKTKADLARLGAQLAVLQQAYSSAQASRWWKFGVKLRLVKTLPLTPSAGDAGSGLRPNHSDPPAQDLTLPMTYPAYLKGVSMDHLANLLILEDEQFVRASYVAILGREGDAEGVAHYTGAIRSGDSKLRILRSLRRSAEGRRHAAEIAGLDRALRWYSLGNWPVFGWLMRQIARVDAETSVERQIRQLAAQVARGANNHLLVLREVNKIRSELNGIRSNMAGLAAGHPLPSSSNQDQAGADAPNAGPAAAARRRGPMVSYFERAVWNDL